MFFVKKISSNKAEILNNLKVSPYDVECEKLTDFLDEKGERISFNSKDNRYFINSFYPYFPSEAWQRFITGCKKIAIENARIPLQADIVVTGRCHCQCWHCFRIKDKREDLSLEEIQSALKQLKELGTASIGITGGEPMLRKDIKEILSSIPDGIQSQLYTTGHNINQAFAEFLKTTNVSKVIISLDHYEREVANQMRHYDNAFNDAINAVKVLTAQGIYTAVTVCITENLLEKEKLQTYFDFVRSIHPNEIRVVLPIPQGNLEGKELSKLYTDAIKFIKNTKKEYLEQEDFPSIVNFCEFESASYFGCGAGANYISINNDGLVTPCVAVPLAFGNIKEKSLKEIFNSMDKFFPMCSRICYGKISGRVIQRENIDTSVTPISIEASNKVASLCTKSTKKTVFFNNFL